MIYHNVKIIPAVLPKSFAELEEGLERLRGIAREVQVDLVGRNVLDAVVAMPLWQDFDFELDIMLPDPRVALDSALELGASRIVVHAQNEHAKEALVALQNLRDGNYPTTLVVSLPAHAGPEVLDEFVGLYDAVQVMGIDHEGKQGEPPDPHGKTVELLQRIRAIYPALPLQVDGGVRANNARALAVAGADRLIVGSAIVRADDSKAAYNELYTVANGS